MLNAEIALENLPPEDFMFWEPADGGLSVPVDP